MDSEVFMLKFSADSKKLYIGANDLYELKMDDIFVVEPIIKPYFHIEILRDIIFISNDNVILNI